MKTSFLKVFALAIVCFTFAGTVNAQMTHGPVAGANIANLSGDDADDTSTLFGFHLGWFVNFDVTDNITVQPQVLYSGKGANIEILGEDFPLNLNYIEIPIWGRYNLESGLHFDFGPYIGFLMGAKLDGESEIGDTKVKDSYTGTDFGIGIGLGYELESGLGFAANYDMGLSNIADYDDGDLKNTNIRISVSYTLGK